MFGPMELAPDAPGNASEFNCGRSVAACAAAGAASAEVVAVLGAAAGVAFEEVPIGAAQPISRPHARTGRKKQNRSRAGGRIRLFLGGSEHANFHTIQGIGADNNRRMIASLDVQHPWDGGSCLCKSRRVVFPEYGRRRLSLSALLSEEPDAAFAQLGLEDPGRVGAVDTGAFQFIRIRGRQRIDARSYAHGE
jgi:hypothetical protein